jgi:putative transposase
VHAGDVTAVDLCCMFSTAIRGKGVPRHLSTDHDPLFEAHRSRANLRILEIDELKTVPHVPMSHPFVERLIGTIRREFLDHVPFWNALIWNGSWPSSRVTTTPQVPTRRWTATSR